MVLIVHHLFKFNAGTMDTESTVIFAIFYGGTWAKQNDGSWQYNNYDSEVTEVPKNCTFELLKDEIYNALNVDRDRYCLRMKFQYVLSLQPCKPQEIRRDKDVKIFLRQVKDVVPKTPLYVDILASGSGNEDSYRAFGSGGGSNHCSSSNPENQVGGKVRVEEKLYGSNVAVSPNREKDEFYIPIRESVEAWENQVPKTHVWDTQLPEAQYIWDTQFLESQLPQNQVPESCEGVDIAPTPKIPLLQGDVQNTTSTSVRVGGSQYSNIESDDNDCDGFHVGQVYDDKKALKQKVYLHAVTSNYQIKVVRSSTTRYEVRCFHDNCKWYLRANKIPHSEKLFIVRKHEHEHECLKYSQIGNGTHKQATSRVLGDTIKDKYNGIARVYKPKEIRFDMKLKYGVDISYDKTWRAREHALNSIRGTAEESFSRLPSYFSMLEASNPGTLTRIAIDEAQCFKYCFMALGASIRGFQSKIRPVIAIDGTTLKHRYRGYLYIAAAVDGNGQIYPLAFGVGDSENEKTYIWFFHYFREAYEEPNNLLFVFDRYKVIENTLKVVYPNSHYGLCMYHISQKLKVKKFGHED